MARGVSEVSGVSGLQGNRVLNLTLTLTLAVAGCARPTPKPAILNGPPDTPVTSETPSFERKILPFPVKAPDGTTYDQAFLGGLDVPRPHFLDIDGDNDLDLFVQERSNELMFFENTGGGSPGSYTWRTDKYADLSVGEWTRFVDIDGDGDQDLLAEQPFSYIRLYLNRGTKQQAKFELAADSVRDSQGKAIFADRQNILNIVDIDCDNLLDLF